MLKCQKSVGFFELLGMCALENGSASVGIADTWVVSNVPVIILKNIEKNVDKYSSVDRSTCRLFLNKGAIIPVFLTRSGFERDMHISLNVDGELQADMQVLESEVQSI
ncbi:MAG: hypothetical protein ABFQ53_02360 [Patescibacteria group bacterium]